MSNRDFAGPGQPGHRADAGADPPRDALATFLEHHLGHRLAARRFLDEVGSLLVE